MSLCRILNSDGRPEYALSDQGKVCPLHALMDSPPVGPQLFETDGSKLPTTENVPANLWQPAPETLLPPVPMPEKLFCIGLNYRDHALETGAEIPSEPVVFSKFNTAIVGHGEAIELPSISSRVDYEAELVVVIGKEAKNISADEAMDAVFGYTCGHDVSARDWQKGRPGGQWLLGKTFDTFAPIGPCVVSKAQIADPGNLRVQMELNGEIVQESTTAQLIFDIPTIVAHLSKFVTLKPGDLIFTGTPPGVGDAKDPPVYLQPGDRCSVIVDGIGTLTNICK
ncbi:Ureidoglycolate lyase [Stieleria bergensis]|uniref:Ureidoglycolate lyase n=1 Tax=Stieleria bergensis TaxID=2528025 RepID=A0A517T0L4_9BACT|nr:Ureidoglycolate lyase [Planctomycetes bacterium SV_7m_r]